MKCEGETHDDMKFDTDAALEGKEKIKAGPEVVNMFEP